VTLLTATQHISGRASPRTQAPTWRNFTVHLDSPIFSAGSWVMKGNPATQLGCCHKTQAQGGTWGSPSQDFQLCQGDQVEWGPACYLRAVCPW
jgi:hypothetical protein